MIEKIVLDYLNNCLDVPCYMEKPMNAPVSYIVLEKTNGYITNHIKYGTLAIQSYAPSLYKCAELNEKVKEKMLSIVALNTIFSVDLNSEYNFTDPSTNEYRYQSVYDLVY